MSAEATADSAAAAPAAGPSTKKLMLMGAVMMVLAIAGGAGAAWYMGRHAAAPAAGEKHAEAKKEAQKKALFMTLEPFTVNLRDERGERFAQIGVTLQFEDQQADVDLKERLPEIRSNILLLLASKRLEEVLSPEGKEELALQIREQVGRSFGGDAPHAAKESSKEDKKEGAKEGDKESKEAETKRRDANPIKGVLFSQFIVQ